tara:strand:+ start:416 stop:694 length:279 start_codon:yes stop_codon:yes gene_type:complete
MQKSKKFFVKILQVFLALIKPASTMPNPACIKNTKNAAISTQTVSRPTELAKEIVSAAKTAVLKKKLQTKAAPIPLNSLLNITSSLKIITIG